jgi:Fe-S-cluster containining protein
MSEGIDSCQGCGACCRNQPYPPFMWDADDSPPPDLGLVLTASILANDRADDEPCLWLGPDGRCAHYDDRPEICREFELGGEDCLRVRSIYQIEGITR